MSIGGYSLAAVLTAVGAASMDRQLRIRPAQRRRLLTTCPKSDQPRSPEAPRAQSGTALGRLTGKRALSFSLQPQPLRGLRHFLHTCAVPFAGGMDGGGCAHFSSHANHLRNSGLRVL